VIVVSDAAVHVEAEKGAINWHIVDSEGRIRSVSKPLEVHNDSYSYRHELHGIYEGLVDTLETHPEVEVIECHCDNEAGGVLKVQQPELYPGEMIAADMDIVLAIRGVIARARTQIILKHVKGH
jgi:hypothetical protein